MNKTFNTVDEYISSCPENIRNMLRSIRSVIREQAPDADENISYGMPAYKLNGKPLVYFAGYAKHIGFYATPSGHTAFSKELSKYKQGRGSVQFPTDQPLPMKLIKSIVEYRVQENAGKAGKKTTPDNGTRKVCKNGHVFYKTSDCPTCPICEKNNKPAKGFLSSLSAPARRALENNQVTTLKKLAKLSEREVLSFHGMGPASLPLLRKALAEEGLSFKQS